MMRKLFLFSTALFWVAVVGIRVASLWLPESSMATEISTDNLYTLDTVALHASADDCWMVIEGQVYDLSAYVSRHPSNPDVILAWCGKEATNAYRTKNRGRPHSSYANDLLADFRIGTTTPPR